MQFQIILFLNHLSCPLVCLVVRASKGYCYELSSFNLDWGLDIHSKLNPILKRNSNLHSVSKQPADLVPITKLVIELLHSALQKFYNIYNIQSALQYFLLCNYRKKNDELRQLDQVYGEKLCDKGNLVQQLKLNEQEINNKDNEIAQFKMQINQMHVKLQEEENSNEEPRDINCLVSPIFNLVNFSYISTYHGR